MKFNERLKFERERLGLSQEELADSIHVTRQSISKWETEKNYPSIDILIQLSDLFQISLDELLRSDIKLKENIVKEQRKMSGLDILGICLILIGIIEIFWSGSVEAMSINNHGYLSLVLGGLVILTVGLLVVGFVSAPIKITSLAVTTLFTIFLLYSFRMGFYILLLSIVPIIGFSIFLILKILK